MFNINGIMSSAQKARSLSSASRDAVVESLNSGKKSSTSRVSPSMWAAEQRIQSDLARLRGALAYSPLAKQIIQTARVGVDRIHDELEQISEQVLMANMPGFEGNSEASQTAVNDAMDRIDQVVSSTEVSGVNLLDGSSDFSYFSGSQAPSETLFTGENLGTSYQDDGIFKELRSVTVEQDARDSAMQHQTQVNDSLMQYNVSAIMNRNGTHVYTLSVNGSQQTIEISGISGANRQARIAQVLQNEEMAKYFTASANGQWLIAKDRDIARSVQILKTEERRPNNSLVNRALNQVRLQWRLTNTPEFLNGWKYGEEFTVRWEDNSGNARSITAKIWDAATGTVLDSQNSGRDTVVAIDASFMYNPARNVDQKGNQIRLAFQRAPNYDATTVRINSSMGGEQMTIDGRNHWNRPFFGFFFDGVSHKDIGLLDSMKQTAIQKSTQLAMAETRVERTADFSGRLIDSIERSVSSIFDTNIEEAAISLARADAISAQTSNFRNMAISNYKRHMTNLFSS